MVGVCTTVETDDDLKSDDDLDSDDGLDSDDSLDFSENTYFGDSTYRILLQALATVKCLESSLRAYAVIIEVISFKADMCGWALVVTKLSRSHPWYNWEKEARRTVGQICFEVLKCDDEPFHWHVAG